MDSKLIREKYLKFFEEKGHKKIDPAPLVLENDPTTLFISAGMQPLIPYLKGQSHPAGKRLVDSQPIFRSQDIEEVGDNRHITFFEMLGNWSLGDYFKKEQISWLWEFLTRELNLPKAKLYVSIYQGDSIVGKDAESLQAWKSLGVEDSHIYEYPAKKNWWSLSGTPSEMKHGDIGGPDSEVFYEFTAVEHDSSYGERCHPNCDCGRFLEIGNSVFIQYQKQVGGSLKELPNKNVDFGGGLERLVCAINDNPDIFETDLYSDYLNAISTIAKISYHQTPGVDKSIRIIADHLRAAQALISVGITPSNKLQGYILRRLIRRAVYHLNYLNPRHGAGVNLSAVYKHVANIKVKETDNTAKIIFDEETKFRQAIGSGLRKLELRLQKNNKVDGKVAFDLYQTDGFPLELTIEILKQKGLELSANDLEEFTREFEKHQKLSRTASSGIFKGGLANTGEMETKYHTATHLLHQALREILGNHILQRGSNITSERLRFDFSHPAKLTEEEIKQTEDLVNQKIQENLSVTHQVMSKEEAEKTGAIHAFGAKYGDLVTIYSIGNFSKEFCGGPHVKNTGGLGRFKISKEESASAGIRRIYAGLTKI